MLQAKLDEVDWSAMKRRGALVVPGFLDEETLRALRSDYASRTRLQNRNLGLKEVSAALSAQLLDRMRAVAARIRDAAGIEADWLTGGQYFAIELGVNEPWHQDHESYFLYQEHYHYLNFWIPIVKPEPSRSNLSFIPYDALGARAPWLRDRLLGGGASRGLVEQGRDLIQFDDRGGRTQLDFALDELAECPAMNAGDLLLLRGDVLHRTQDATTPRVSVSFRLINSKSRVSRRRLSMGSPKKLGMMLKSPGPTAGLCTAFAAPAATKSLCGSSTSTSRAPRLPGGACCAPWSSSCCPGVRPE
jgi:hypothetical protein